MNEGVRLWKMEEENRSGTCCLSLVWVGCRRDRTERAGLEFGGSAEPREGSGFAVQGNCLKVKTLHTHLIFQEGGIVRKWRKGFK